MSTLLNSKLSGLTQKGFERIPEVNLERTPHFGKASKTEFKTGLAVDEEIEFTLTPEVSVSLYQGDTSAPQELANGMNKIRVQYPLYYNFIFYDQKIKQVNALAHDEQSIFMGNLIKNASDKFENAIEYSYIALITQAGFTLNTAPQYNLASNVPISVGYGNVRQIFQDMRTLLGIGQIVDGVPRTSWIPGKMSIIVPFALTGMLIATKDSQFTLAGEKDKEEGYIGEFAGFKILESNYLSADALGNYYVFAFIDGEAFGTIMQKALTSEHLRWQLAFGDVFRGLGIFGVGMIRPDKCASAYITFNYSAQTTI